MERQGNRGVVDLRDAHAIGAQSSGTQSVSPTNPPTNHIDLSPVANLMATDTQFQSTSIGSLPIDAVKNVRSQVRGQVSSPDEGNWSLDHAVLNWRKSMRFDMRSDCFGLVENVR
jgi:hypothetical protein